MFTDILDKLIRKDDDEEEPDDEETSLMNISADDSAAIHEQQNALSNSTGDIEISQRERLKRLMVDAFSRYIVFKCEGKVLPGATIYTEFVLGEDCTTLYLKDGKTSVTWGKNPNMYLVLSTLDKKSWG